MNFSENDTSEQFENQTIEEYLLRVRGPKHLPLNVVLPISIVYIIIFVTGVVGNIAVCVVIVRNVSLHTATNYYLFSLAFSDLMLLLLGKLILLSFCHYITQQVPIFFWFEMGNSSAERI